MNCPNCGQVSPDSAQVCDQCGGSLVPIQQFPLGPIVQNAGGFVGRVRELKSLNQALNDAFNGMGRVFMLAGEPGIGKTRLAQELASQSESQGAQVLWGRCFEEQGLPPYWPWVQSLRSYVRSQSPDLLEIELGAAATDIAELVTEIKEIVPSLVSPVLVDGPEQSRFRLFSSITNFLNSASQHQPLVLVLEDLHWADQPSLSLLEFLAREISQTQILLIGTYRDVDLSRQHPLSACMSHISREPCFSRENLSGITSADVERLIRDTTGVSPGPDLLQTIYALTEGNPFFIREVVKLLLDRGDLTDGRPGDRQVVRVPDGVREVIDQRLNRLSETCHHILSTAGVIGREFQFNLLQRVVEDITEAQMLEALEAATEAHVIEELPDALERYQFCHSLIHQNLLEGLLSSRRVRVHLRIAQELEQLHTLDLEEHAAEIAYHYAMAGTAASGEKLTRYSRLAGEQALEVYAWEDAVDHFSRALAAGAGQGDGSQAAEVLFELGRAQWATLEWENATQNFHLAFSRFVADRNLPKVVEVVETIISPSPRRFTGTGEMIRTALGLVEPGSHPSGRLLSIYGRILGNEEGNYSGADEAFAAALSIAQREHDLGLEVQTLAHASNVDAFAYRWDQNMERNLRAIALAQSLGDLRSELDCRINAARGLYVMGNLSRAKACIMDGLNVASRLRDVPYLARTNALAENVARLEGDWASARQFADAGLSFAPRDPALLAYRTALEYQTGNFIEAEGFLSRLVDVMRSTPLGPNSEHAHAAYALALAYQNTGKADFLEPATIAVEAVLSAPSAGHGVTTFVRLGASLLAVENRDAEIASRLYQALEEHGGRMPLSGIICFDRLLGQLALTMGCTGEAVDLFKAGIVFCRQAGFLPELGWLYHDAGNAMLTGGEDAVAMLQEALGIAQDLEMEPLQQRVAKLLQRAENQPVAALDYPDGLTSREVEVLQLVSTGKTDREIAEALFISVGTARTHVRNILNKTGANNRTEAATYASRLGLV